MSSATATKTTVCKSVSYFGEKCKLRKPHTKRHTWDSDAYRRKRKADIEGKGGDTKNPSKKASSKRAPAKKTPTKASKASKTSEVIDVMISFDTTGSMNPCITAVRRNTVSLVETLFKDIPDLRIGIIAHGDYCDNPKLRGGHYGYRGYVTKHLDLTRDVAKITNFVKNAGPTGGGDAPECYELVLHEARKQVSWQKGRNKVLVMIGDATPHPPEYHLNTKRLDWQEECRKLAGDGIAIYPVQCLRHHTGADYFWQGMAKITGGQHLVLDKFENIRDLLKAVCYKQQGVEALETFVRSVESGGRMTSGMSKVYSTLLGREIGSSGAEAEGAKHVDPSRFIVFKVTKDAPIKDFVKLKRKTFRVGCGYYQFTKSVKVQDHKEIILVETATGDLFGGKESRRILGLPEYGTIEVSPKLCAALQDGRFTAFVQSTSVNRKLIGGTQFLYENERWDG